MTTPDVLIRGGAIYDGLGGEPFNGDVLLRGGAIAAVAPGGIDAATARGAEAIDAGGLAVAPGFINVLSWAGESLLVDGRSQSDIRQGVTLEVLGEGWSMGPWNDAQKRECVEQQGDLRYAVAWTTLGEYLDHLVRRGVSCNVASFVGATTVRIHELGYADRRPTAEELERMKALVRGALHEGALGVSSALIYVPATFADTDELVALASVAAECGGLYISHIRNEGDQLLEAFDEFCQIARRAKVRAEVYHLKASGQANWGKFAALLARIAAARERGEPISADMYTYHASSTGLDSIMPPWVQEGGLRAWIARLRDPDVRARVKAEMNAPTSTWDNGWRCSGGAENILLVGLRTPRLKPLAGRTLADVAAERGLPPEDTAMQLVLEDESNVGAAFFSMSEDNVRQAVRTPWISFCSDAQSVSAEGVFLQRNPHPRTYGAFARLLGRYVRDERLIPLREAIRRLTSLPAANLHIPGRGRLAPGCAGDVVVFDPTTVADRATFKEPHQYAVGVRDVLVNGVAVLRAGEHTGAQPGQVVRGPAWRGAGG
jgi:N-acyl-D-amino-acid deacylase